MPNYLNFPITLLTAVLFFFLARYLMNRQMKGSDSTLIKHIVLVFIILGGLVATIVSLPSDWLKPEIKNAILSFLGVIISAAFALSSTSFLGNAFAGLMIRAIRGFKHGDFINVGDHFGRVSERGLFHVEIQTEDGRLTTLPNLLLVTKPVEVIRSKGPLVYSEVSLGYDVPRSKIETALKDAAERAKLTEPFVYITSLGDFSVVYRIHGVLKESKELLTARSRLNAMIMDSLHEAAIEIVSPTFMNQRRVEDIQFIPKKESKKEKEPPQEEASPESIIFEKAMQAESIEKKKEKLEDMNSQIKELQKSIKDADSEEQKEKLQARLDRMKGFVEQVQKRIQEEEEAMNNNQ